MFERLETAFDGRDGGLDAREGGLDARKGGLDGREGGFDGRDAELGGREGERRGAVGGDEKMGGQVRRESAMAPGGSPSTMGRESFRRARFWAYMRWSARPKR